MNLPLSSKKSKPSFKKILHSDEHSIEKISDAISYYLHPISAERPIIVVCVGTDRSTGDSLGPMIGTKLQEKKLTGDFIYGTLDHPVHAINLQETLHQIKKQHHSPFIIGVDACLGQVSSIGYVQIGDGPVRPGAGVHKTLPPVGHIHITGIVNVGGFMEYFVLQNTRLSLIMKMADRISAGIENAIRRHRSINPSVSTLD